MKITYNTIAVKKLPSGEVKLGGWDLNGGEFSLIYDSPKSLQTTLETLLAQLNQFSN